MHGHCIVLVQELVLVYRLCSPARQGMFQAMLILCRISPRSQRPWDHVRYMSLHGGGVDRVTMDDSLDIEASVECVVEDVIWDGPRAIEFMLWDESVVLVEFGFCNLVIRNVYSSVSVCTSR